MGEAVVLEALHAAAFVIDADQHILANTFDVSTQVAELAPVFPVAGEQNNAASERMFEATAVGFGQGQAGDIDDQGRVLGHSENFEVTINLIAACACFTGASGIFQLLFSTTQKLAA